MARKRNSLKLNPVLFIACEGTSTEYDYFNSWAQEDGVRDYFQAVNVYPGKDEENPKTNPHQLVAIAKEELECGAADIAWVVFDRDGHPLLEDSFEEAEKSGVKIAFSSRSFEEWVLMHFEKCGITFNASECKKPQSRKPLNCGTKETPACNPVACLSGYIRSNGHIANYSKKKGYDLYNEIRTRTDIAMVNSAWLRSQVNASINNVQPALHIINPYTDVDSLISLLLNRNEIIEWGTAGNQFIFKNWHITVSRADGIITLTLSHSFIQAQAINQVFEQQSFFTTDEELNNMRVIIESKNLILAQNGSNENVLAAGDIIRYCFYDNEQPYFIFCIDNRTKVYFQLD